MITVLKKISPPFNFILLMLKEIGHILLRKIHDKELKSLQYLGHHENILIVFS